MFLIGNAVSAQVCPPDVPPDCSIATQFPAGRMALSAITGSYEISGSPIYDPGKANYS